MTARARRRTRLLGALAAGVLLEACSGSLPAPPPTATATPFASATATAGSSAPAPAPTPHAALDGCPTTPASATTLPAVWRGGSPDDIAVAPDGALWVSDVTAQVVRRVAGGVVTRTIRGIADPEGVAPLLNGDVVVAEQGRQRILAVHPDDSRTVLLTLPSAGGQLGVDGIGWDPASNRILVPDSPHGTLLSVAVDRPGSATTLASGLPRVVGVEPGTNGTGTWLAAEAEAPRGLLHLTGGTATPTGNLAQLDDVALAGGLLYVTDLRNHSVHAVDLAGAERTIATGFGQPQGLAVLPDGSLAVADSGRGVVQRVAACTP